MKATLLAVDDDAAVLDLVKTGLGAAGFRVLTAGGADEAVAALREGGVDLLLLDVQMHGLSGFQLLELLKKDPATATLPVIMITSRSEEKSRVQGLRTGADDYVVKPFSMAELSARVDALLRRVRHDGNPDQSVAAGPLRLDAATREVWLNGRALALTDTEFRILLLLARHPGRVVTREAMLREISAPGRDVSPDTVYVHLRNLRTKLGKDADAIASVHGVGYRLAV